MFAAEYGLGYRIVGAITGTRRLVELERAQAAYAVCDPLAEVDREAYLSAFCFGTAFRTHLTTTGSPRGYQGACWSPWLWFDLDGQDGELQRPLADALRLAEYVQQRYDLAPEALLRFFSGGKGFHLGLPTSLFAAEPGDDFPRQCRAVAEGLATRAGVAIDTAVYDRVRAFRAPNSRHPRTGLYKRRLSQAELSSSPEAMRALAATPAAFELPAAPAAQAAAVADWQAACLSVVRQAQQQVERVDAGVAPRLIRRTMDFIREGAEPGERHSRLYSAAVNLTEFDCPAALAHELLTAAALDSGLPPGEIRRTIDDALAQGQRAQR